MSPARSPGSAVFRRSWPSSPWRSLLDDGRPVLFRQARLGYRRRPFEIFKFRSMRGGAGHPRWPSPARHRPRRDPAVPQHPAWRHERRRSAAADGSRCRSTRLGRHAIRFPLGVPARPDRARATPRRHAPTTMRWCCDRVHAERLESAARLSADCLVVCRQRVRQGEDSSVAAPAAHGGCTCTAGGRGAALSAPDGRRLGGDPEPSRRFP